jgi:hypothetical protein
MLLGKKHNTYVFSLIFKDLPFPQPVALNQQTIWPLKQYITDVSEKRAVLVPLFYLEEKERH